MKKQLLALAVLTAGIANAQTWSENFSSATPPGLPTNWLQNNVDGKTPNSAVASYSFGTNAWVTKDFSTSTDPTNVPYGKAVASNSYYTPVGAANDWLISPSFTVPTNAVLEWEGKAVDPSYPDGYLVKISTTGTLTTDFSTTLLTVGSENSSWTSRGINLSTYAGQTVRIAFVNNSNDMFLLLLDNIKVIVPASTDGNVTSITGLTRYTSGTSQPIAGTFVSKGYAPVTTAVLNYKINSGAVTTQTFTYGTPLNYNGSANYSFTSNGTFALGKNVVKVWVSSVNGTPETILTNDTVSTEVFVASQSVLRNALIEEFSSSTCGPCASLNATFDPMLNGNTPNSGGRLNVIKNQVNWPSPGNDPSYNPHSAARVTYYGINAAPTALINGHDMVSENQAGVDAGKLEPAFANITANLTAISGVISGSATITPFVTVTSATQLKVHQVLIQEFYNYPGAVTSQKNYYHIMRKMFPSASGTSATTADGVAQTASFTHTVTSIATPAQNSYDFWNTTNVNYEYVVFVQDVISDDILQSGSAKVAGPVGVVELKDNQEIGIYPNPANEFAVVGIKLNATSNVDINIYDMTGKLVYTLNNSKVDAGHQEIKINTSAFANGTYNVIVKTENGTLKDKLTVIK